MADEAAPGQAGNVPPARGEMTAGRPAPSPAAPRSVEAERPAGSGGLEGVPALRDTIFERLVEAEDDVVGLLAYSLSMQNKRDWLSAFQAEQRREPTVAEMTAYDIGERIVRRLATYRKLAEQALAGNPAWAHTALTPVSEFPGPHHGGSMGGPPSGSTAPDTSPPRPTMPPARGAPRLGAMAVSGRLAMAGGVFAALVVAALAARHWMGV